MKSPEIANAFNPGKSRVELNEYVSFKIPGGMETCGKFIGMAGSNLILITEDNWGDRLATYHVPSSRCWNE